ncbi:YeiH family protein [Robiginitomaculum antarcticum]|uniref:YeiH family protein n=1 Tax=Robiginitomaculum antarcticum TaxID=437507 RepID=UPI00036FE2E1|nr:putative sulfate exporter family transporter [Robiginitomaculum antarcticum]
MADLSAIPAGFKRDNPFLIKGRQLAPGIALSILIAGMAVLIEREFGGAAMLYALVIGMCASTLNNHRAFAPGIKFSASTILKLGIILLGARITFGEITSLGWLTVVSVLAAVMLSIGVGAVIARAFKLSSAHAILTAGAVSICGASAAMAVFSVIPKDKNSQCHLAMTLFGITVLSTIAMIAYPLLTKILGFNDLEAGAFMGMSIHNVAQAVGAGFIVSESAAETATLLKLMRVATLAPVVIIISIIFRRQNPHMEASQRPPILPLFLIGFLIVMVINSAGIFSAALTEGLVDISHGALLISVAAIGTQTSLGDIKKSGLVTTTVLVLQSVWLAVVCAALIKFVLNY